MFGTWLIHSPVPSHTAATVTLWEQREELSGILCSGPDIDTWNVSEGIWLAGVMWHGSYFGVLYFVYSGGDVSFFRVKLCRENMESCQPHQGVPNCVYCLYTPDYDVLWQHIHTEIYALFCADTRNCEKCHLSFQNTKIPFTDCAVQNSWSPNKITYILDPVHLSTHKERKRF